LTYFRIARHPAAIGDIADEKCLRAQSGQDQGTQIT
jgi:hypothetical protein